MVQTPETSLYTGVKDRIDDLRTRVDRTRISGHPLYSHAVMCHLDPLGADSDINLLADQTAGNRVDVLLHVDRAAAANRDTAKEIIGIEPTLGQAVQMRLLNGEATRASERRCFGGSELERSPCSLCG